jgi:hypothetical protein
VTKNLRKNKKGLDRADIVRDFRFPRLPATDDDFGNQKRVASWICRFGPIRF